MAKIGRRFGKSTNNYRLEDIWADADEISGTIQKMEKNYPSLSKKIFIITEGPYDYEFYSRFFNSEICEIRFANSKENVISVITDILKDMPKEASQSIIGIVDRDFSFFSTEDYLKNNKETGVNEDNCSKNLFFTDTHDIETMIISEELIKKVLRIYETNSAGGFQRRALMALRDESILNGLVECSRLIGLSLYVNEKYDLRMTFKHINCKKKNVFMEFVDSTTIKFNEEKLLDLILKRNKTRFDDFKEALSKEISENTDYFKHPMQICRGHDLMCVLLADINRNYPAITGEKVRLRDLERLFRDLYDEEEFFRTDLFRSLKCWADEQTKNIPQPLFIRDTD